MMKKYKVYAERIETLVLVVEADSPEEAEELADEVSWDEAKTLDYLRWQQIEGSAEEINDD